MSNHLRRLTAVALAFLMITVSGCLLPGKFTAGGTLPNLGSDNGKATFTGHADSCAPATVFSPKFEVNYNGHDGVTLMSTAVADAGKCAAAGGPGTFACGVCLIGPIVGAFAGGAGPVYGADFTYESKNPDKPGTGTAVICVQDNGQPPNAATPDEGVILVNDGPFGGYFVAGPLSGNVEAHPCD